MTGTLLADRWVPRPYEKPRAKRVPDKVGMPTHFECLKNPGQGKKSGVVICHIGLDHEPMPEHGRGYRLAQANIQWRHEQELERKKVRDLKEAEKLCVTLKSHVANLRQLELEAGVGKTRVSQLTAVKVLDLCQRVEWKHAQKLGMLTLDRKRMERIPRILGGGQ